MIDVKDLTMTYPSGKGIFDVSFSVREGEVFGYLGPNGAGKTTTIRNILGFARPSEGHAVIDGKDVWDHAAELQKNIGYIPGEMAFFQGFNGTDFLDFLMRMRGLGDDALRKRLCERFDFDESVPIKKMSKGMKQKLGIVAACMHDPDILILDEPTAGLDPLMQNEFLNMIEEEKRRGKTVLMSSHIFEEVERVCDRAGIIKEGRIITVEDFSENEKKVDQLFEATLRDVDDNLEHEPFFVEKKDKTRYLLAVRDDFETFFGRMAHYDVIRLESKRQTIEDIFMRYYRTDGENDESTSVQP